MTRLDGTSTSTNPCQRAPCLAPHHSKGRVLESLDQQYREQGKPPIWFLPLTEPIAPHLNELLGPVAEEKQEHENGED